MRKLSLGSGELRTEGFGCPRSSKSILSFRTLVRRSWSSGLSKMKTSVVKAGGNAHACSRLTKWMLVMLNVQVRRSYV